MHQHNEGFVNLVFYDLPTTFEYSLKHYRVFRKKLLKLGYYQLQESVYCKHYSEKTTVKRNQTQIKQSLPAKGNIRSLTVTKNTFDSMEVILGELSIEERIIRKTSNVVEL